jgi:hypothetical protein
MSAFYVNTKNYWWYIDVVKFRIVLGQRKVLSTTRSEREEEGKRKKELRHLNCLTRNTFVLSLTMKKASELFPVQKYLYVTITQNNDLLLQKRYMFRPIWGNTIEHRNK